MNDELCLIPLLVSEGLMPRDPADASKPNTFPLTTVSTVVSRLLDPAASEHKFQRELEFCSGCLMKSSTGYWPGLFGC